MATKKKTVKKTTKKVMKRAPAVVKLPAFNKANAKLFADNIYSDKGGRVTFLKLCDGDLSNGKDGGRTLHCALGEAYFTFVNPLVAKFVKDIEKKFGDYLFSDLEDALANDKEYFEPKYKATGTNHTPTRAVADALVDVAQLKSPKSKDKLAQALLDTMSENDDTCGIDVEAALQRAEDVARVWREKVIPLLK